MSAIADAISCMSSFVKLSTCSDVKPTDSKSCRQTETMGYSLLHSSWLLNPVMVLFLQLSEIVLLTRIASELAPESLIEVIIFDIVRYLFRNMLHVLIRQECDL